MNGIVALGFWQVVLAYVFVLIVLALVRIRGIGREKEIVVSSIRMTLQLVLIGYLLVFIFEHPNPFATLGIIAVMELFAVFTVFRKFRGKLTRPFKRVIAVSMVSGTLLCIAFFLFAVVRISPWYEPRYFIPISGMLIGNSMTGISLGVKSLADGMIEQRSRIEQALALGAEPSDAVRIIVDSGFEAAIMPTVNSMIGMGIVFLPGMMTGQILSGTSPAAAIAYQIVIMLGILGSVAITVILVLTFGYRTYFNREKQLELG